MRLICPNCGAQYEVADDVIPSEGRDVQCSNCGHTWFENRGASDVKDDLSDTPDAPSAQIDDTAGWVEDAPAPAPAAPERQELDPAIADILREEAAREAEARKREAEAAVESQPDLGLDAAEPAPDQRSQEAQRRMSSLNGEDVVAPAMAATAASRRELLPDIEEINSSLRSEAERGTPADNAVQEVATAKKRRGFRLGFFGVLTILAILTLAYIFAPQISEMVPALTDMMTSYVAAIDNLRLWVDLKLQDLMAMMESPG